MCISPEQQRQKDEARRQAIEKTYNVNAAGQKTIDHRYSDSPNQINNE